ncbi:DUF6252 family protein [Flavobacterium dankookense]|uniref:Lipoprotein n=1 Tax=Flavobacterium dankookense TaxID=706186 RepID=A0A4V6PV04_9FLAO|nr:DUF6252 family protein [Flavobacterium dankookense]TDP58722.1 hypothetical protein BC748_1954 [Flavobacterium dankookense]
MKKLLSLFIILVAFSSCEENVKFSDPGFQALQNDVFWRANDARAYLTDGKLTIEAYTEYETVTLGTSNTNLNKFSLGTINPDNFATYSSSLDGFELEYATIPSPGPVSAITLVSGGTGYEDASSVATTGGSGSGLSVNLTTNASGVVTNIALSSRGNAYMAGDLITVTGGNLNCRFRILNVQNSNGEIEITKFDNVKMTVSGKFKFNAVNTNNNPLGGEIMNYQQGEFYNVPIYPSL